MRQEPFPGNREDNSSDLGFQSENLTLDMVLREWPNVENNDRVQISQYGDTFEITILEDGIGGPYRGAPLYLAPRVHNFKMSGFDAKYDRNHFLTSDENALRVELMRLHVQRTENGSNTLVGWQGLGFAEPRKTFRGLLNRARGVFDIHDHLQELVEKDSVEIMIQHQQNQWLHWLLCKNSDDLHEFPFHAQRFLQSIFGDIPPELTLAFQNPELLEYGFRMPIFDDQLPVFEAYYQNIIETEEQLKRVQDVVTGKAARKKNLASKIT